MGKRMIKSVTSVFAALLVFGGTGTVWAAENNEEDKVYKIGIEEGTEPPMAYWNEETGRTEGILVEATDLLAGEAGLDVEYVLFPGKEERIRAAKNRSIDFLLKSGTTGQEADAESSVFLEVPSMAALSGRPEDVKGSLTLPYGAELPAKSQFNNLKYRQNYLDCLKYIRDGGADYTIGNAWVLGYYMQDPAFSDLIMIPTGVNIKYSYLALDTKAAAHIVHLNEAMKKLDYGELQVLICKYVLDYHYNVNFFSYLGRHPEQVWLLTVILAVLAVVFILLRAKIKLQQQKEQSGRLILEESRYRVAAEISNDILFEYVIEEDLMKNSDKYREIFGRSTDIPHFIEDRSEMRFLHEEDYSVFESFCTQLCSGKEMLEAEFRMEGREGDYVWCHLRGKSILGENGKPLRVVGKIVNIDIQKKELEKLQYKAQLDPFTGIYNKEALREVVQDCLLAHSDAEYAFIMLDVDDFKHFNDEYGHLCGDRMLTRLVSKIHSVFRGSDTIGRIGGDEFVIFTKLEGREELETRLRRLSAAVQENIEINGVELGMTISMGAAFYPWNGINYLELFEASDKALYETKNDGKNSFTFAGAASSDIERKQLTAASRSGS